MFALNGYVTMSQRPLNSCVFEISWILSSVQMIVFKLLQDELWIENNKEWHVLLEGGGCSSIIAAFLSFLSLNYSWHALILALGMLRIDYLFTSVSVGLNYIPITFLITFQLPMEFLIITTISCLGQTTERLLSCWLPLGEKYANPRM